MNIDRHNYEEYFILYWDNELTEDQKRSVKLFVEQNPDLEGEFRLLGETRFNPDEKVLFTDKEMLAKKAGLLLNASNYQEWLIAYVDNELDPAERSTVGKFVAAHPSVKTELSLFEKTRLLPDAKIIYPDKSSLYRTERKVGIIEMRWFRMAVAAAIILFAGFGVIRLATNSEEAINPGQIAQEQPTNQKTQPASTNDNNGERILPEVGNSQDIAVNNDHTNTINNNSEQSQAAKAIKKEILVKEVVQEKTPAIAAANPISKPQDETSVSSVPYIEPLDENAVAKINTNHSNTSLNNTSVTERNTPTYNNDDIVFANYKEDNNGGIRGLLRKATRVFERRTNVKTTTDDNKLLVGVFAVSLN